MLKRRIRRITVKRRVMRNKLSLLLECLKLERAIFSDELTAEEKSYGVCGLGVSFDGLSCGRCVFGDADSVHPLCTGCFDRLGLDCFYI